MVFLVTAAVVVGLLAGKTVVYQGLWKSNETLSASYRQVMHGEAAASGVRGAPGTPGTPGTPGAPQAGWGSADPRALNDAATGMIAEGRLEQAEHLLQMALQADPGFWMAEANLGALRIRQRRWEEAAAALARAAALNPGDADVWTYLGDCHRNLGHRQEAAAAYRRALALSPQKLEAVSGLAAVGG